MGNLFQPRRQCLALRRCQAFKQSLQISVHKRIYLGLNGFNHC